MAGIAGVGPRVDESTITWITWATPSTSPAVLRAHALIAKYYHCNNACTVGGKPWVKPTDCDMLPDHAIAELIQAVPAFPADTVIGRAMPTLQTEGHLFTVQRREQAHHS